MKKAFTMPKIVVEQFVPNEYVSACGDSGKVYYFECNAGKGVYHWTLLGQTKYVWEVVTEDGKVLASEWDGLYGPCGEKHEAESDSVFLKGYMDDVYTDKDEHIPVIIWTEGGKNVHCTTNLNMSEWETAKS